jgi:hypothetical protein
VPQRSQWQDQVDRGLPSPISDKASQYLPCNQHVLHEYVKSRDRTIDESANDNQKTREATQEFITKALNFLSLPLVTLRDFLDDQSGLLGAISALNGNYENCGRKNDHINAVSAHFRQQFGLGDDTGLATVIL